MADETRDIVDQRLSAMEARYAEQKAQIDGLVEVLSDLLAAHVVLHKDLRLCTFLRESVHSDTMKESEGGTLHFSASYFAALASLLAEVLQRIASSRVFDQYWFKSLFWRGEERQRAWLEKARKAIEQKLDF